MNYEVIAQWSEIIGGIGFVVVAIWLFRKFALPAVRSAAISSNAALVNAERRREELRAEVETAKAEREAAVREAEAIAARSVSDAARVAATIVTEARNEGTRLLANAAGEIDRARNAARDQLRIEFIEKALLRARALASTQIDAAIDTRLVDRTVDDFSAGTSA
jgi:F0F1-type ATP synthase membrane subunit b/b'